MTRFPFISELGRGMGWHAGTILAMLWMYLDESGEHDSRDGHLRRLALGGGIAPFSAWEALSLEWSAALEVYGVPAFHMTDFEARQPPFDWDNERRKALLSHLLDIAVRHVPIFWGTVGTGLQDGAAFRQHYMADLAKPVTQMTSAIRDTPAEMTIVFANHKNISAQLMCLCFDRWTEGVKLNFGGFGDPAKLCPLQVADIVAYEFCRATRAKKPEKRRYPLQRLMESPSCQLVFAETIGVASL